ncbi:MAG: hypothetical protein QW356_00960 [Candidatus Hadarchaeales archaeon]
MEEKVVVALEKLVEEVEKLRKVDRVLPRISFPIENFCFGGNVRWPEGPGEGLFNIVDEESFLLVGRDLRLPENREEFACKIVERLGRRGVEVFRVLKEIERAVEWCRKTAEELKERKRKVFEEERKAVEELRARSCLEVLAKGGRNGA